MLVYFQLCHFTPEDTKLQNYKYCNNLQIIAKSAQSFRSLYNARLHSHAKRALTITLWFWSISHQHLYLALTCWTATAYKSTDLMRSAFTELDNLYPVIMPSPIYKAEKLLPFLISRNCYRARGGGGKGRQLHQLQQMLGLEGKLHERTPIWQSNLNSFIIQLTCVQVWDRSCTLLWS